MTPGHQIIFNYPSLSSASDSLGSTSINDSTGSAFHPQAAMQSNAIKHSTIKNLTPQFMKNEGCPESNHPIQTDFDSVSQISQDKKTKIVPLSNRIISGNKKDSTKKTPNSVKLQHDQI